MIRGILCSLVINTEHSNLSFRILRIDISSISYILKRVWSCFGEVAEWLKAHAWKVCIRQRIEGSNPSLSAITLLSSLEKSSVHSFHRLTLLIVRSILASRAT